MMVLVKKEDIKLPFSKGILARSLMNTGVSTEESYEIVSLMRGRLQGKGQMEITSNDLKELVSKELLARGYKREDYYYRTISAIKSIKSPVFILIGGGSGVGKSTISSFVGQRLGINRVISTDTVREIMRAIISPQLIPTLHKSTFDAGESLKAPLVEDKLMYAFQQQASLINEGLIALLKRARKEGLKTVVNGVHIVPGYLKGRLKEDDHLFQYILDIPDIERHKEHFYHREEGSLRDPERYIKNIENIRRVHTYILDMAEKNDVLVIKNDDMVKTTRIIVEDVLKKFNGDLEI